MIRYINSAVGQSGEIAKIHLKSFPNFFLTTLGCSFLKTYYKSCSKNDEAISLCAVDEKSSKILGFVVGCQSSKGFNQKLISSNLLAFLYQALKLILTKPLAIIRLLKNLSKRKELSDLGNYAELLSIGVLPDQGGMGIGQNLLAKFEN